MIKLGERLRKLREHKGMTMKAIAQELGISYTTYIHYEKNENEPNNETLVKIAVFYDVSADYLLGIKIKDNNGVISNNDHRLSNNQQKIVELFDILSTEQQNNLIGRAELFAEQNESERKKDEKRSG